MKKNALIILIQLFITPTLFSQPYQSIFGDSITQWNVHINEFDYDGMNIFKTGKDTLINGITHKSLYEIHENNKFYGYIREDTLAGKVWKVNNSCTNEILLVDLSLSVNDTFNFYYPWGENEVLYCDSIGYRNGKKFIRLETYTSRKYFFYEGIGPSWGIYSNFYLCCYNIDLLCKYNDNKTIYKNPEWDTCFYIYVKTPKTKDNKKDFTIYPNPATSKITITSNINEEFTFILRDLLNREAIKREVFEKETSIDVSFLAPGNYFYQIITNKGIESGILIRKGE